MPAGVQNTFRAMIRCAVGKDHTFVNMGTLANRTNVCYRTIERHIKTLKEAKLITAVKEEINGWTETVYYFLAHPAIVKFRELRSGKAKLEQSKSVAYMQIMNLKGITTSSYENAMEYIWSGIQTLQNDFIDLCTEDELRPLRGLFDFMAYYEDRISYEYLFNKFKKEHRLEDFTKVSKKDFQKIIMLAWGTMYAMCLGDKAGCCKASCIHNQL